MIQTLSLPTLYVMVGIPGSGKSTFAKKYLHDCKYISRDEIRFAMINATDDYFSQEKHVFIDFIKLIQQNLQLGYDVIADATHLSTKSRKKLITAIGSIQYNLIFIVMATNFDICLERNDKREGRQRVPKEIMNSMYARLTYPHKEDFDNCKGVWIVDDN